MLNNQKVDFIDLSDPDPPQTSSLFSNLQSNPSTAQSSKNIEPFSSNAYQEHDQMQKKAIQQDLIDIFSDSNNNSNNNNNKVMSISHKDKDVYQIQEQEDEKKQPSKQQNQQPNERVTCCSFSYYQYFFDINTTTFAYRLTNSLWPFTKRPFLTPDDKKKSELPMKMSQQNLNVQEEQKTINRSEGKYRYDLYGPIWIPSTLIVLLSLSGYVMSHPQFDIMKILAIGYVTYGTLIIFPLIFFLILKCELAGEDVLKQIKSKRIGYYQFVSVYGYSFAAFFLPALLGFINIALMKWILLSLATFVTLWMLNKEFGDLLMTKRNSDNQRVGESVQRNKTLIAIRIFICLVQVGYMLVCALYFLSS